MINVGRLHTDQYNDCVTGTLRYVCVTGTLRYVLLIGFSSFCYACFRLSAALLDYNRVISAIPWCLTSILRPYRQRVETVIRPGLESLSWKSTNVDQCKCVHVVSLKCRPIVSNMFGESFFSFKCICLSASCQLTYD